MKHTPGPWYVGYKPEIDVDEVIQTGAHTYSMTGGYNGRDEYDREMGVYAIVDDEPEIICQPDKEGDAILIHAVIDLLAACEAMIANVERWLETGVPADPEESKQLYDQMRAAVEKAKGEPDDQN